MNSLTCEINGFSKTRLKKQSTRVTTVTGRRLIETLGEDGDVQQVEEPSDAAFGFVEDSCLDLQVGVVRPFLLLCETCVWCGCGACSVHMAQAQSVLQNYFILTGG